MHPALSIIVFTSLSGTGLGLGFWTALTAHAAPPLLIAIAGLLAAMLTSIGLVSSLLHLRHPSRAWRAFSQWRSSWLSREGILAPLCVISMVMLGPGAFTTALLGSIPVVLVLLLAPAVILTTAMIYAQLRAVPAWRTWLTPVMFLLFGASSGLHVLMTATVWYHGDLHPIPLILGAGTDTAANREGPLLTAIIINTMAWGTMAAWWLRRDRIGTGQSTLATATRLASGHRITQLDPPHTEKNYLQTEMGYHIARKHALSLRWIALVLGFLVPTLAAGSLLILPTTMAPPVLTVLSVVHGTGIMVSRWLFFAEATHVQSLYYHSG